ncbi:hypothetical protein [Pseudomonas syringae]|uniref:hypothetical protein n=1 Tax=Pseudomonas syringae TaxID=317 RepID=UPI00320464BF
MFMQESSNEHGVRVVVSNANLAEGWDIVGLDAKGMTVPPTRKGEFATAEEAEKAGYERGAKFLIDLEAKRSQ